MSTKRSLFILTILNAIILILGWFAIFHISNVISETGDYIRIKRENAEDSRIYGCGYIKSIESMCKEQISVHNNSFCKKLADDLRDDADVTCEDLDEKFINEDEASSTTYEL